MNIVMLSKRNPDYLHDAIYLGMRNLGHTVQTVPEKKSLQDPVDPDRVLRFGLPAQNVEGQADLLIICALYNDYMYEMEEYQRMLAYCYDTFNPKKVVIVDGADGRVDLPVLPRPYDAYFVRELLEGQNGPPALNMPFAAQPEPFTMVPYAQKDVDFCFLGSYSGQPYRLDVMTALQGYASTRGLRAHVSLDPVPRKSYLDIASRSKVVVSVRGYGWDCYRYWETPAKGLLMLTETMPIVFENDYVDGVDCFKCRTGDTSHLLEKLTQALAISPEQHAAMVIHALARNADFHTPERRAQLILSKAGLL